jgi:hypothetical protein
MDDVFLSTQKRKTFDLPNISFAVSNLSALVNVLNHGRVRSIEFLRAFFHYTERSRDEAIELSPPSDSES